MKLNSAKSGIFISIILLIIALCSVSYGIFRGEAVVVLTKAIRICMECIGLG